MVKKLHDLLDLLIAEMDKASSYDGSVKVTYKGGETVELSLSIKGVDDDNG